MWSKKKKLKDLFIYLFALDRVSCVFMKQSTMKFFFPFFLSSIYLFIYIWNSKSKSFITDKQCSGVICIWHYFKLRTKWRDEPFF